MIRERLRRLAFYRAMLRRELARWEEERRLRERFPTARFEDDVKVISPERLELGEDVLIHRGVLLHCGGFAWSHGQGRISIGAESSVGHHAVLWGAGGIEFGRNAHVGVGSIVFSSQSHFEVDPDDPEATHWFAPVRLEDDVAVFADTLIVPGVTIGRGAVVGAKSLVLRDIPAFEMWAGVPARKIRELDRETWKAVRR